MKLEKITARVLEIGTKINKTKPGPNLAAEDDCKKRLTILI